MLSPHKKAPSYNPDREEMALSKLLSDEDPVVFAAVRERVCSLPEERRDRFLSWQTSSADALVRQRAHGIHIALLKEKAQYDFTAYLERSLNNIKSFDLERAVTLFCKTEYPQITPAEISGILDLYAESIRESIRSLRLTGEPTKEFVIRSLCTYLSQDHGIRGSSDAYVNPECNYLNMCLRKRIGGATTLCLIYMLAAKRLNIALQCYGLPLRAICGFHDERKSIYVNCSEGKEIMYSQVESLVRSAGHTDTQRFLVPLSGPAILLRVCGNLENVYRDSQNFDKYREVRNYQRSLSNLVSKIHGAGNE